MYKVRTSTVITLSRVSAFCSLRWSARTSHACSASALADASAAAASALAAASAAAAMLCTSATAATLPFPFAVGVAGVTARC